MERPPPINNRNYSHNSSTTPIMMNTTTNPTAHPYNAALQMSQQQPVLYPTSPRVVSPVRALAQPRHLPLHPSNQVQAMQQLQINTSRSHDSDEHVIKDAGSDVSSIHMGSILPVPNYDPAKDPTTPERIDEVFVPPSEITIRVVKGRRRKTMGGYQSSTTRSYHSSASHSTTITPPSVVKEEQPEWLTPNTTMTETSTIPGIGFINSFASDVTISNSFSGSIEQFQSASERKQMEEELMDLQGITKDRHGMVRRRLSRKIKLFQKKKNKSTDEDDDDNASGNKIIIKVDKEDDNKNKNMLPQSLKIKSKNIYPSSFGNIRKHHRSNSMRLIVGQENGC